VINNELKKYIEENIFPIYERFYSHGMLHVNNVINNALMLADCYDLNKDMCYVMASYHDVGLKIDRANHEKESGKILKSFSSNQLIIVKASTSFKTSKYWSNFKSF